jgi:hypothetical protein
MGQSVARHLGVAATIRRLGDPMTNLRGGRPHPKGHPPELVNRMYDAWMKSMILQENPPPGRVLGLPTRLSLGPDVRTSPCLGHMATTWSPAVLPPSDSGMRNRAFAPIVLANSEAIRAPGSSRA